jgi:antirestriction protein ArdC
MSRNLQSEITQRILTHLKAGTVPWRQPWSSQASGTMPRNGLTGRAYNGCNIPLLWMAAQERGYTSPKWLTFKNAIDAGGNVRRGEKGNMVVYVSTFDREKDGRIERIPFLKAYTVFNVCQCDGIDKLQEKPAPVNPDQRNEIADQFVRTTGATIINGGGSACYQRDPMDRILMPDFASFSDVARYYATEFHELTHWSGAPSRLNRIKGKRFGDSEYSFEELVAELGSAFLCAEFGYDNDTIEQSSAYIAHWIKVLTDHEAMFTSAASHASKAVEYMRTLAIAETGDIAEAA